MFFPRAKRAGFQNVLVRFAECPSVRCPVSGVRPSGPGTSGVFWTFLVFFGFLKSQQGIASSDFQNRNHPHPTALFCSIFSHGIVERGVFWSLLWAPKRPKVGSSERHVFCV